MGGHVLVECMSSGWHIYDMLCFAEGHVFLEGMYYRSVCFAVPDVSLLMESVSYRKSC